MRLKEDTSNWNSSAIIHRDNRHDKSPRPEKRRSKKNTRRWCKGKVGVEHEYEHTVPKNSFRFLWVKYDICKKCGRQETRNATYYCRHHKVWDKHIYWNEEHNH